MEDSWRLTKSIFVTYEWKFLLQLNIDILFSFYDLLSCLYALHAIASTTLRLRNVKINGWVLENNPYFCSGSALPCSPFHNEKIVRENSDIKWTNVPLLDSIVNKYLTVFTSSVTFCERLKLLNTVYRLCVNPFNMTHLLLQIRFKQYFC